MADMIVTVASEFRVRNLSEFLAHTAMVALRKHFTDPECSPTGEAGYFNATPLPEGYGLIGMGGYCGMPEGTEWLAVIRTFLAQSSPMRISTAGFDAALKYTVAAAYDISTNGVRAIDASYGSTLGNEWFRSLPGQTDPRDRWTSPGTSAAP